jgi:hypothetical protein
LSLDHVGPHHQNRTGNWKLETSGIRDPEAGSWKLAAGNWQLETSDPGSGIRKLEAGSWKLATGNSQLETGYWLLETD